MTHQQRDKIAPTLSQFAVCRQRGRIRACSKPAVDTDFLDRTGERLVEGGVALHIDHLMRQLMKDEPGQFTLRIADEGRQQRVRKPAQRGVGRHAPHVYLQPTAAQPGGKLHRLLAIVIAAIANAASHGEAPALELHRQRFRRKHIPQNERTAQIGIAAEAAVIGQGELTTGECAHVAGARQARAQDIGGAWVRQHLVERAGAPHHVQMPRGRLPIKRGPVLHAGAARQREQPGCRPGPGGGAHRTLAQGCEACAAECGRASARTDA